MLLINRSDIARYKQLSKTPHDDKLNEQIYDAQLLDMRPLLGEKLFNLLIASPEQHTALLDGGDYEHWGETYRNYGVKMVLSYFAYARYVMFSSFIDTPFSLVEKLGEGSRPMEATSKKAVYQMNREAAIQLWQNVEAYMIRTGYAGFKCEPNSQATGFRLKKIV